MDVAGLGQAGLARTPFRTTAEAKSKAADERQAKRLEDMRERTPRGSSKWYPSSVRSLLLRAERSGLITA